MRDTRFLLLAYLTLRTELPDDLRWLIMSMTTEEPEPLETILVCSECDKQLLVIEEGCMRQTSTYYNIDEAFVCHQCSCWAELEEDVELVDFAAAGDGFS
tara:strand:- start:1596 stop:1895 length:300 start_codon:yes stop_codon:yes gene_type:complete